MVEVSSVDDFELREITSGDGETLEHLMENNPDGGEIQFAPSFKTDPYELYEKMMPMEEYTGFIAETPTGDAVGAGIIGINDARIGGELRPRGYLAGLMVDHDYRGMGLGKRLAAERIQWAEEVVGDDVIICATIQSGNGPSEAVASSWMDGFPYEYVNHSLELRDDPPETEYSIRSIDEAELPEFTSAMNEFYSDAELFTPYQTEQIADLLHTSVDNQYVHRCDVLEEDGEFVAGAHVIESHKLMKQVVEDLPPELEEADELPPSIPEDREVRPTVMIPWYKNRTAAETLIDYERATAGDANRLMITFDPDGPLGELENLNPDDGSINFNWAVRGFSEPVEDAFVAPGLG